MLQDVISIGDKIELMKYTNQDLHESQGKRYYSRVLDFKEMNKAVIAMPVENSRIIPLDLRDKYRLCFYTKYGLYQCRSVITDRYRMGNIYMIEVEMTSELEKVQRRQYYRLDCVKQIHYYIVPEASNSDENVLEETMFGKAGLEEATMIDISGGGCKFNCKTLIPKDSRVIVRFSLELSKGIKVFQLVGKVVYSSEILNHEKTYENRIEFLDIKEEERENIVRFIFNEERRRRKKGNA
ncbi:MAG: flagellar brake domain-containing protein [Clostridiales bacterium]|nr:flagellar brake domain-containing protein [Clostridiales bacterium]